MDFPKSVPGVGLVNGKFIDEDPLAARPGSLIPSAWGNAVTQEILGVIASTGVVPDEADLTQLRVAIEKKIADGGVSFATQAEAEAGTSSSKVMSPVRVFQAIAKVVVQATETTFGWLKIATQSLVNAGTDDATAVTPKKLGAAVQAQAFSTVTTTGTPTVYLISPVPAAATPSTGQRFSVVFHLASGANPVILVSGRAAKSLKQYDYTGAKVPAVILSAGQTSDIVYDGTDFVIQSQLPAKSALKQGLRGAATNWRSVASGTSASIVCTAAQVTVADASGNVTVIDNVNMTLNTAAVASATVNGMASGAVAVSTWYGIYVWYNSSTGVSRLTGDSSFTAPTAPAAGFDQWCYRGSFRTDGTANKFPLSATQTNFDYQWGVASGSNVPVMVQMTAGAAGNPNDPPAWQNIGIAPYVSPVAKTLKGNLAVYNNGFAIVAPNNSYAGLNQVTNAGSPFVAAIGESTRFAVAQTFELILESSNIYYAANGTAPRLFCIGWSE